jgi:hypothetical protein
MLTNRLIAAFLLSFAFPTPSFSAVNIEAIDPVVAGYEVKIAGNGFGESSGSVNFALGNQNILGQITGWTNTEISVVVPVFLSVTDEAEVELSVTTAANETRGTRVNYKILSSLIRGVILQKKRGFSDEFILNQFDKETSDEPMGFGSTRLRDFELVKLKDAGFNDDIIGKFGRHKQYLTIGVAGVWLRETTDLAASPILRIFLKPKSFFDYRKPFWSKDKCFGALCFPSGFFDASKYDLNIGYTAETSTTNDGGEKKSYLLAGFSFELNRSALFNFGWALVPGDTEGTQSQVYFGLTVDSNFLRDLGILEKG